MNFFSLKASYKQLQVKIKIALKLLNQKMCCRKRSRFVEVQALPSRKQASFVLVSKVMQPIHFIQLLKTIFKALNLLDLGPWADTDCCGTSKPLELRQLGIWCLNFYSVSCHINKSGYHKISPHRILQVTDGVTSNRNSLE